MSLRESSVLSSSICLPTEIFSFPRSFWCDFSLPFLLTRNYLADSQRIPISCYLFETSLGLSSHHALLSEFLGLTQSATSLSNSISVVPNSVALSETVAICQTLTLCETATTSLVPDPASETVKASELESATFPFLSAPIWKSKSVAPWTASSDSPEARVGTASAIIGGILGGLLVLVVTAIVIAVIVAKKRPTEATDGEEVEIHEDMPSFQSADLFVTETGFSDAGGRARMISGSCDLIEEG
jgi:hypothetical protein